MFILIHYIIPLGLKFNAQGDPKAQAFKWLSLLCCQAIILGDFYTSNAQSRSTVNEVHHKKMKFIKVT
jgi:hypothetical protein